jgi:hypothetical protein
MISSFSHMGRKMEMTSKASREFSVTTTTKILHLDEPTHKYADKIRFTFCDILEPIGTICIDF